MEWFKNLKNDLKNIKWKNLKNIEKRILIAVVILILGNILISLLIYSIYAYVMKYNLLFDEFYVGKIGKFRFYYPNAYIKAVMETTPKALAKTRKIEIILRLINVVIIIVLVTPFDKLFVNTSQGNARWGNFDDLGYSGFFIPTKAAKAFEVNLLEETGVVLGKFNNRILYDNAKTHILLSAPTRTGKGVAVIIPTLVTWIGSVFVLDVKGENYNMTAGYRQKFLNNKILKFSPKNKDSCHYNPLNAVRYLTDREMEDIKTIANLIVVKEGGGSSDPFWEEAGSDFMSSAIIYVLYKKRGKGTMADVVEFITDPSAPLIDRMTQIINERMFDSNKDKKIIEKLLQIYPTEQDIINKGQHPAIVRGMAATLNAGEKTMASIVATAKTKLSVFEMPTVKINTNDSDFKIEDLLGLKDNQKPISLYLCIEPGDLLSLAPLIRILTIQIVTLLSTPGILETVKNRHRLLMLLDEFPTIGKMEILEKGIGFVAGYGMKMMLVVQSMQQLNQIYTKDNAFISNCQVQIFYTANENETAEYINKTVGSRTIKTISTSGSGFFKSNNTVAYSSSPLIRAEEARRFPLDELIILAAGKMPIKLKKILFFIDKEFKDKINIKIDKN